VASESIDSYRDLYVQNKTVLGENPGGAGASWGYVDGWKTRRRRGKTGWRWRTRGARVTVAGWVGSGME